MIHTIPHAVSEGLRKENEAHLAAVASYGVREIRERYSTAQAYAQAFLDTVEGKQFAQAMRRIGPEQKVLDIGAGYGRSTIFLASRGYRVIAVEPAPALCDFIEQLSKSYGLQIDIYKAPAEALDRLPIKDFGACIFNASLQLAQDAPVKPVKTAVFVGALDHWVDLALLDETAKLLGDWHFDLYGPAGKRALACLTAANLAYRGPAAYEELPKLLARYQVGLIPFKEEPLIAMMERPLKFYEYLAAGLGIAATAVGMLETGMGSWAQYGSTPRTFADAILRAARDSRQDVKARAAYLQNYSWSRIGAEVLACLNKPMVA